MSQQLSKWWLLGPPFAIAVSILAYYAVFPSFRGWVDEHFPWAATHIGIYLPVRDADEQFRRGHAALKHASEPATPAPATPPLATPPPVPVYLTADGGIDLAKLAANRADWPKAVVLKKAHEFPAVVEGKAVGNVIVPKGTEVHLLKIESGKLGVEYRGGGVWVESGETDLPDRMRSVER